MACVVRLRILVTREERARIAVVNHDPAFLEAIEQALEAVGPYEVFTFRDQETSLAELRAVQPDLVVIDVQMDTLPSGWELAVLAGADDRIGPVPVIVTSPGLSGLRHRIEELRAVANVRVLPKPFELDALQAAILDALGRGVEERDTLEAG